MVTHCEACNQATTRRRWLHFGFKYRTGPPAQCQSTEPQTSQWRRGDAKGFGKLPMIPLFQPTLDIVLLSVALRVGVSFRRGLEMRSLREMTIALSLALWGCGGLATKSAESEAVQQATNGGQRCLDHVCGTDEYCCNPSCGICAPIGGFCTDDICHVEPCGDSVCGPREYCCNPSCGICAPLDGFCTDQVCHWERMDR